MSEQIVTRRRGGAEASNSSLRTAEVAGRTYRAKAATRGCDGCAAARLSGGRDLALCNALPPCASHERGHGGDIVWAAPRGAPRVMSSEQLVVSNEGRRGMSLTKANGNMYPWVTHMHSHLRGACPHACPYCYATKGRARRFAQGPLTFRREELNVGYGSRDHAPKTIFVEHTHDLFAAEICVEWIAEILRHCRETPYNTYVFQTRNTERASCLQHMLPPACMLGTTIETNRAAPGNAPHPKHRARGLMGELYGDGVRRFVTIEPVLDFDLSGMLELLDIARPEFVNIGADSKGCGLAEPSAEKVLALIDGINALGIEIRQKTNLDRLLRGGAL